MCRWGCGTVSTTYMCKWCGTRFCKECLRGDFGTGLMLEAGRCKQCNQPRCQGPRVEYVVPTKKPTEDQGKTGRGRSASPSKSARSSRAKSAKSAKSGKKSGKKSAGKKKKKKK